MFTPFARCEPSCNCVLECAVDVAERIERELDQESQADPVLIEQCDLDRMAGCP